MNNIINNTKEYAILPNNEDTNFVFGEVNFEKLPIFSPDKKKNCSKKISTYTYIKGFFQNGKSIQLKWEVTTHPRYGGFLNYFDRDIYRCLQKIITERGLLNNGYVKFSIYEIIEMLGRKRTGKNYKQIKNSLYKMMHTSIQSSGIFYDKGKKTHLVDTFHFLDRFTQRGEDLPNGSVAETNYIKLSEPLLKSMQSGYFKPVNFDYYMQLKTSRAKAFYSRLSVDFYGLPDDVEYLKKRYSLLCDETIITYQKYPSYAKRDLKRVFTELIDTKFLSKVEFVPIPNEKKDFFIKFYPGELAKEPDKFKTIYPKSVEVFEPEIKQNPLLENKNNTPIKEIIDIVDSVKDELSEEDQFILNSLLDIKVTKPAALECVKKHKEKTKYWLKAKDVDNRYQEASNKAGFILMAIKRNWSSPYYEKILAGVKQQKSFELKAQIIDLEKRRQELWELEEKLKLDEFYYALPVKEKEKIEASILNRLKNENAFLYDKYKKNGLSISIKEVLNSFRYEKLKLSYLLI